MYLLVNLLKGISMTIEKNTTRKKKIYYRRAQWQSSDKRTLEHYLLDAHNNLANSGERTFLKTDAEITGSSFKVKEQHKGILIHVTGCKPGEQASLIESDKTKNELNTEEQDAPDGKEFLDGDIFAFF